MGEQVCYQSEGIEFIYPLFSHENGRFASVKRSSQGERFYVQGGSEKCLLLRSFAQESSKLLSTLMEGKHLRVLVYMVWSGFSTSDTYKIIEDSR